MRDGPGHGQAFVCKGAWCNTTLLIHSNWLSLSCNWLCIYIYLCNFMYNIYMYIYILHMILQSCSKIWFTKNWLQTIWGFQSRAPQAVSNLASTRHLSVWAQERCGRPSGSQKPWAMEGTIPWNDDFMPWNDDFMENKWWFIGIIHLTCHFGQWNLPQKWGWRTVRVWTWKWFRGYDRVWHPIFI